MKICIISNLYSPYARGGAELNSEKLAIALSREHKVMVVTTEPFSSLSRLFPRKEIREGIKIYRFYPLNLFYVYFIPKRKIPLFLKIIWRTIDLFNLHTFLVVLFILKKERPDIVHTSNLGGFSFSCFWSAKLLHIPLAHTLRDYHLICPYAGFLVCPFTNFRICKDIPFPCKIYSLFKKIIVDSIPKVVIGPSKFIVEMHKNFGFFRNSPFVVIPNFIDVAIKQPPQRAAKKTLDILYVGSLYREKGVDILIKAFTEIGASSLRLRIVGDGPERERLQDLTETDLRIKFYGGKNTNELKQFYSSCDLLVVPSICYENFPTVILEAFSFGIPVIASRIGGIPEIINDGYNGFLFASNDKAALSSKIKVIISDSEKKGDLLTKMKENAFKSSANYDKEEILAELIKVYEIVVG